VARRIFRNSVAIASLVTLLGLTTQNNEARAGAAAGGATEVTQIVNMVTLFAGELNRIRQVFEAGEQAWKQTEQRVRDVLAPVYAARQTIDAVRDSVNQGQAIAYSLANLDQVIRDRYKSFDDFMLENYRHVDFSGDIRQWSETTRDSISNALQGAGIQLEAIENGEQSTMDAIYVNLQNAEDRQRTLDVANQIGHFNNKQLQSLRQLVATQMQIQAAYFEQQNAIQTVERAKYSEFLNPTLVPAMAETIVGDEPVYPNITIPSIP